jgi:hypothetical protein
MIWGIYDVPDHTACPNPCLGEIVERWREERLATRKTKDLPDDESQLVLTHTRQPFATDVSEGKNDQIYNLHSYHTKVPHKAIMRYADPVHNGHFAIIFFQTLYKDSRQLLQDSRRIS